MITIGLDYTVDKMHVVDGLLTNPLSQCLAFQLLDIGRKLRRIAADFSQCSRSRKGRRRHARRSNLSRRLLTDAASQHQQG
ncbi:hypothetical protein D3C81_2024870 [compost metagenome]